MANGNIFNDFENLRRRSAPLFRDTWSSVYKAAENEYVVHITDSDVFSFNLRDFPMLTGNVKLRFHAICDGNFTTVATDAFVDWISLRSVKLPPSVTVIEEHAFSDCDNLKLLMIPCHLRIGPEMFYYTPDPEEVILYGQGPVNEETQEYCRSRRIRMTRCDEPSSGPTGNKRGSTDVAKPSSSETSWNSREWARRYKELNGSSDDQDRAVLRNMRKEVFLHTVRLVKSGGYTSPAGTEIRFPDPDAMQQNTQLYDAPLFPTAPVQTQPVKIYVENRDCLVSAEEWRDKGYRVAVLNMASRQNPGGGVYNGAGAQEENLFRRTNLFQSLYLYSPYGRQYCVAENRRGYPLDRNYGGAYSPYVTVFRGTEQEGYPLLERPFSTSVISVAGINRPELTPQGLIAPHLVTGLKNKIRTIFNIGLAHGHDCLILGALGCGAFRNPPRHVARLFHEILKREYKRKFRAVVFAILEDHNSRLRHNAEGNYRPFYEEFKNSDANSN